MYTLLALVGTIIACVIAHSPGVRDPSIVDPLSLDSPPLEHINRKSISEYLLPRYLAERLQYVAKEQAVRIPYPRPLMPTPHWLDEEIDRISQMKDGSSTKKKEETNRLSQEAYRRILFGSQGTYGLRNRGPPYTGHMPPLKTIVAADNIPRKHPKILYPTMETMTETPKFTEVEPLKEPQVFALTPLDEGYFEPTEKDRPLTNSSAGISEGHHEGGGQKDSEGLEMHRQIRQNPNHSRTKTLVDKDLDKLREGLSKHQMRMPVSLIPTNLKWLKITKDISANGSDSTDEPKHIRVFGSEFARGTVYAVGIAASIGTVFILAILGFIFGWYIITKRAKAAANVDYPAYGVTGPTVDTSGDRKLAHSAQMYHYQHQKQQITAMERNNAEQRDGSISDPESEENEEGDYTVYECPGFATTGDLEVKNPLFNEGTTPAAVGKLALVKPSSKE